MIQVCKEWFVIGLEVFFDESSRGWDVRDCCLRASQIAKVWEEHGAVEYLKDSS